MKRFWLWIGTAAVAGFVQGQLYDFAFPRFRLYSAHMGVGGYSMPVFLKSDNRTGQCWKSQGMDKRWTEMSYETIMEGVSTRNATTADDLLPDFGPTQTNLDLRPVQATKSPPANH